MGTFLVRGGASLAINWTDKLKLEWVMYTLADKTLSSGIAFLVKVHSSPCLAPLSLILYGLLQLRFEIARP